MQRQQIIDTALRYTAHTWHAQPEHACHTQDINTPDAAHGGWWQVGENVGVPYCWGGASTLEVFDAGLACGKFAGNVPLVKPAPVSRDCVGVDCSGLMCICWGLPRRISTREIPTVADLLPSTDLLLPGDILAKPGSHVMFFMAFADEQRSTVRIVDATRSTGKVSVRELSLPELLDSGYLPFRKHLED